MHSRFALLAGGIGALVLLRLPLNEDPAAKAAAFPACRSSVLSRGCRSSSCIYGRLESVGAVRVDADFSLAFVPGGLTGLLFDERFGLVANAPVLLFGFAGLVLMYGDAGLRSTACLAAAALRSSCCSSSSPTS